MGVEWVGGKTIGIRTMTKSRVIALLKDLCSHCRKNTNKQIWARTDVCDPYATIFVGLNMCQ